MATTASPDRSGDIFDPLGATFTNPIPLLLHHDKERPIGIVTLTSPRQARGLPLTRRSPKSTSPGPFGIALTKRGKALRRAYSVAYRLASACSTAESRACRRAGHDSPQPKFASSRSSPCPRICTRRLHTIKSLDMAALGQTRSRDGDHKSTARGDRPAHRMTAQEKIQNWENSRAAKVAAHGRDHGRGRGYHVADDKQNGI